MMKLFASLLITFLACIFSKLCQACTQKRKRQTLQPVSFPSVFIIIIFFFFFVFIVRLLFYFCLDFPSIACIYFVQLNRHCSYFLHIIFIHCIQRIQYAMHCNPQETSSTLRFIVLFFFLFFFYFYYYFVHIIFAFLFSFFSLKLNKLQLTMQRSCFIIYRQTSFI